MTREIIALGWPVGHLLGREAELLERWRVSRAVFREAVAIAEKQDLIEMRRGRGGGLVVKSPPDVCASTTIRRYLAVTGFSGPELSQARSALEGLMVRQACDRMRSDEAAKLRTLLGDRPTDTMGAYRRALALIQGLTAASRNPCLSILVDAIAELTYGLLRRHEVSARVQAAYAKRSLELRSAQVEAVIGCDLGTALALQQQLNEARDDLLAPLSSLEADLEPLDQGQSRLADEVSTRLLTEIRQQALAAGSSIGTQQSLMANYRVSRGVLRAAVRRLEQIGAVRMEAGRSGGLQVATPAPDVTIRRVILYINCTEPSVEDVIATQEALELAVVTLVAGSGQEIGQQLSKLLHPALPAGEAMHEFGRNHFLALAEVCGNRILLLLIRILTSQLSAVRSFEHGSAESLFAAYLQHLRDIIIPIQAGDIMLARRATTAMHRFIASLHPQRLSPIEIGLSDNQGPL
jgi:DNA-binding FadR family transcriptional regulator